MPRKGPAVKRELIRDYVHNSKLVAQLINVILLDGKKSVAESIVYGSFDLIKKRTGNDPLSVFKKAVDNIRPLLKVKPRRVGGATYQVPIEVHPKQGTTLALRWLVDFARGKTGKSMTDLLTSEILDAAAGTGVAVKKKEDTHKMAEANRAFAHYRW